MCVWVSMCLSVCLCVRYRVMSYGLFFVVCVLMCACVLCLMSLHAVCELSCDDVWCSMCVCVCVFVFRICAVCLRAIVCDVWFVCVVCCCCLNMFEWFDCDTLCDDVWFAVMLLIL